MDGHPLMVHSPGQWNRQAGPDFLQAVLEFDSGERQRGDVEVHRLASGWTAHQHHVDPRYNRVILHVVLQNDRSHHEVERADGQVIPQVALAPLLPRPLGDYVDEIPLADYPNKHAPQIGQCYTILREMPLAEVQRFLQRAGEARLMQRMQRWSQRISTVGTAQAMYEAVFRSLGASGYGQRFLDIARRLPWQEAQRLWSDASSTERSIAADAFWLGAAGFLPPARGASQTPSHTIDEKAQAYVAALNRVWNGLPRSAQLLEVDRLQIDWRHPHVRPMNTPERRLAGMAQLFVQYGNTDLCHAAMALCRVAGGPTEVRQAWSLNRALIDMLQTPMNPYWGTRSHFGSQPRRTPQRLIGRQRGLTIVVDAMLPVLLCEAHAQGDAELERLLLACYREAPRLPDNAILRDMSRRLLGDDPALLALVTHARHQQGMMQIFEDYCSHDEGGCQGCEFPQP